MKKSQLSSSEYDKWMDHHRLTCDNNYSGSSGMMETEAASVLCGRSVEKFRLRYTKMVADGDAKSFNHITELRPYADVTIEKEECVNHVGKRMGTALCNMVSDCSKKGITLGGKGKGRLTQATIRKLSIYYTIRKHKNVADMRNAILASMYHGFSTDNRPMHQLCPEGPGSWCFYNSTRAKGEVPNKHSSSVLTPLNYNLLHRHLKPLYRRLSDPKLLERCMLGATQNANESLHNSIWNICSKNRFSSLRKTEFLLCSSIGEFNFGHTASYIIKDSVGLTALHHSRRLGKARDTKRTVSANP